MRWRIRADAIASLSRPASASCTVRIQKSLGMPEA
jgi:hypothetical protein